MTTGIRIRANGAQDKVTGNLTQFDLDIALFWRSTFLLPFH